MNKNRWQLSITVVLLVLGILLSLQFKTQQDILESLAKQKTEDLAVMWKSLNENAINWKTKYEFCQSNIALWFSKLLRAKHTTKICKKKLLSCVS